jgi:hypothetical protein
MELDAAGRGFSQKDFWQTERGIHAASTPEVAKAWNRAMSLESRMVKRHKCRAPSIASLAITDPL